ncbi:MAG: hypothetical protein Q9161_002641 [Pseudevernia consocians]
MHRLVFHHLKLLPLVSGTVWVTTLLALLIYWLSEGRPRYPGQANPYVAFISDIGAFRLQPLFISGGVIASLTLTGTIVSVHVARRERRLATQRPGDEQPRYENQALEQLQLAYANQRNRLAEMHELYHRAREELGVVRGDLKTVERELRRANEELRGCRRYGRVFEDEGMVGRGR